jgi:ribosomal protein S27E
MNSVSYEPLHAGEDPTRNQFDAYARAFDWFNRHLFDDALPRCLLNFSRHAKSMGFFAPLRWSRQDGRTHEISINPDVLHLPFRETMQTLVHEMVHLWQQECGQPSRTGYHNHQWAAKMEEIGLMPSSTGQPGGKRIGQKVSDYPTPGGRFLEAFEAMPETCRLPWLSSAADDAKGAEAKKKKNKVKYSCPGCKTNVWGKAGLEIRCEPCGAQFFPGSLPTGEETDGG